MHIANLEQLQQVAQKFVENIEPRKDSATVIALRGDLGAGKTTFTQAVARMFGVGDEITSPTFVLIKRYPLQGQKFKNLIHVDAYRLDDSSDLQKLGFTEMLADPNNIIVIEWPEIVEAIVPKDAQYITFTFIDETTREIVYD